MVLQKELGNKKVSELKDILRESGLKLSGKKNELIQRIILFKNTGEIEESKPKMDNLNFNLEDKHILPMLAHKYQEKKSKIQFPMAVSPKIDGIRCISRKYNDEIVLSSRVGNDFVFMDKIRNHLSTFLSRDLIMDGELYIHDKTFNEITSIVKQKKQPHKDVECMNYYIFDIINTTAIYTKRMIELKKISRQYKNTYPNPKDQVIKFVFYETVNNHSDVDDYYTKIMSENYEGIMIRKLDSLYSINKRSNDLLKYKEFSDKEFKIVNFKQGMGNDKGAIIFECITIDGQKFWTRPSWDVEKRRLAFKNGQEFINKYLTVRFQFNSKENFNVPRFPVGISVRDYE
jgi:ATP-dependent DNA ligase